MRIMYLSGPIGQNTDATAYARILGRAALAAKAQGRLLALGWASINPYSAVHCSANFELPYDDWLTAGLACVGACDAICMLPGWQDSNGCQVELAAARKAGLEIYVWERGNLLVLSA